MKTLHRALERLATTYGTVAAGDAAVIGAVVIASVALTCLGI
ncbi:MAG: hypothetical protein ABIR98_04170 [Usitatibacter sp.]